MSDDTYRIEIASNGLAFDCPPGQTLLMAALAAGIQLPNSCRNGTCRTCISWVLEGKAEHKIKWPGLSFEEKKAGWILPCVACAGSDLLIEPQAAVAVLGGV